MSFTAGTFSTSVGLFDDSLDTNDPPRFRYLDPRAVRILERDIFLKEKNEGPLLNLAALPSKVRNDVIIQSVSKKISIFSILYLVKHSAFIVGGDSGTLYIYQPTKRKMKWTCIGVFHTNVVEIYEILYLPTKKVAIASSSESIIVFNIVCKGSKLDLEYYDSYYGHEDRVRCLCMLGNDRQFVSASDDRSIRMWHVYFERESYTVEAAHDDNITSIVVMKYHYEGFVATGSDDFTIKIWNFGTPDPNCIHSISGFEGNYLFCMRSLKNGYLATGHFSGEIRIWDLSFERDADAGHPPVFKHFYDVLGMKNIATKKHSVNCPVEDIIELQDGNLVSCSHDGTVKIWICGNGRYEYADNSTVSDHNGGKVLCLSHLFDHYIVNSGEDGNIRISRLPLNVDCDTEFIIDEVDDTLNSLLRYVSCSEKDSVPSEYQVQRGRYFHDASPFEPNSTEVENQYADGKVVDIVKNDADDEDLHFYFKYYNYVKHPYAEYHANDDVFQYTGCHEMCFNVNYKWYDFHFVTIPEE